MIYHDDGNRVIMRKHRDMIVSSCGCHWSTVNHRNLPQKPRHPTWNGRSRRTTATKWASTLAQCWTTYWFELNPGFTAPQPKYCYSPVSLHLLCWRHNTHTDTHSSTMKPDMSAVFIIAIFLFIYFLVLLNNVLSTVLPHSTPQLTKYMPPQLKLYHTSSLLYF